MVRLTAFGALDLIAVLQHHVHQARGPGLVQVLLHRLAKQVLVQLEQALGFMKR
ncbi:MAG TPA: hypothetical protein VIW47_04400 [Nitrospiraceae bacterium]|jgi:hypothetical protein